MKVLDNKGCEIGKISDLGINWDELKIESILVSTGEFFGKKYFTVNMGDLGEIDSSVHLKCSKEDVDQISNIDLKNSEGEHYFFKDFQNIYVTSADAKPVGPVKDLYINSDDALTFKVIIEASRGKFSKNGYFMIDSGDINDIREFIILNLNNEEIKQRIRGD